MKKAIDWFALVLGVALALNGARWMWTGWDIVQAERGWASLIAGSVMLSGGLIVATLAWTIMRLTGLTALARRAPADEEPVKATPKPSIAAPAAAVVGAAAGAAVGLALPRREAEEDAPPPEAPAEEAPPPSPLVAPPTVGELLRMSKDRAARDTHEKVFEEPELPTPPVEPALAAEAAIVEAAIMEAAIAEEAVAPPVEPPAPPPPPPAPPPPVAAREPEPEQAPLRIPESLSLPPVEEPVHDDWLERTAREFDRELGRDNLREPELKDEPPSPAPAKPEPEIVGRYSSGDTNYLMFADGSIEAQTPEGVMRFASLTELKRFVEKRN